MWDVRGGLRDRGRDEGSVSWPRGCSITFSRVLGMCGREEGRGGEGRQEQHRRIAD